MNQDAVNVEVPPPDSESELVQLGFSSLQVDLSGEAGSLGLADF